MKRLRIDRLRKLAEYLIANDDGVSNNNHFKERKKIEEFLPLIFPDYWEFDRYNNGKVTPIDIENDSVIQELNIIIFFGITTIEYHELFTTGEHVPITNMRLSKNFTNTDVANRINNFCNIKKNLKFIKP